MYRIRYFTLRLLLVFLLVSLQACGGGDSSEPDNNPVDTNTGDGSNDAGNTSGETSGRDLYVAQCANCHGSSGEGTSSNTSLIGCISCSNHNTLASSIETTMPPANTGSCDASCSSLIADYILTEFNSDSSNGDSSSDGNSDDSSSDGSSSDGNSDDSSSDGNSSDGSNDDSSSGDTSSDETTGSSTAVIFAETFEDGGLDTQPAGWDNFLEYNYNTNNTVSNADFALIDDTYAYNGSHSIHFKGDRAQIVRALPANTQRVYLRAYVRMSKQMGNVDGDNHEHIMGIKKTQDANNEVRIGQIKGVLGTNDVPTDNIAPTSTEWESGKELAPDTWYCVETGLYADTDYDEVHLWVDGVEVHSITSASDWNNGELGSDWMSDKFNYVMFGFHSFSGNTADVWMDDIVVSTEPVGCAGMPSTGDSDSADDGSTSTPDATHGATLYGDKCASCHGTEGGSSSHPIVASKSTFGSNNQPLAEYISDYMVKDPASCDVSCVDDIAAYINSWETSDSADDGSTSTPDATHGATLYGDICASCHGTEGGSSSHPIVATKSTFGSNNQPLAEYISDYMVKDPASCDASCVDDIAAYIDSWVTGDSTDTDTDTDTDTTASCGVTYGPRSIRVLTKREFANSVEDLTGVNIRTDLGQSSYDTIPADNMIDGYSNNIMKNISSGSLQGYNLVIDKVVDHLAASNFSAVIDCTTFNNADACVSSFMADYLPQVFRRPLTDTELSAYQGIFASKYTGGNVNEGLALALRTALTSPQFLYRDESGVAYADLNSDSSDESGSTGDGQYEATGGVQTFISSATTIEMYQQFGTNANFTGNDLITVTVKGVKGLGSGAWPTLIVISPNGEELARQLIDHDYDKTYSFHITALDGTNWFAVVNKSVGPNDYMDQQAGGHELIVSKLDLSLAQEVTETPPTTPEVELDSDAYVLTPYQLASYLAYTFTGSTPDQTLLQAAGEGGLETDAQVAAQVERLLGTARAREHFGNFAAQWLRTDPVLSVGKNASKYPGFTDEVRQAMAQEVRDVFNHVVLDEGEPFTDLYDGDFTFVNQALAEFYGIPGVTGDQMRKVSNVSSRAGLVTNGAFLAVHAHEEETAPIIRSTYLRRRLLCHEVPIPPTGVSLTDDGSSADFDAEREQARQEWQAYLDAHDGKATARRKYEFQTSAPICQACHAEMINPLGGGFEDFDAVGLPQTQDNGQNVNASGVLYGVDSVSDNKSINFNGAKELAHAIADLDVTRQCFVETGFRMAMGTGSTFLDQIMGIELSAEEIASYTCEVQKLDEKMQASGNSPVELLKALGTMDSVRYRKNVVR